MRKVLLMIPESAALVALVMVLLAMVAQQFLLMVA